MSAIQERDFYISRQNEGEHPVWETYNPATDTSFSLVKAAPHNVPFRDMEQLTFYHVLNNGTRVAEVQIPEVNSPEKALVLKWKPKAGINHQTLVEEGTRARNIIEELPRVSIYPELPLPKGPIFTADWQESIVAGWVHTGKLKDPKDAVIPFASFIAASSEITEKAAVEILHKIIADHPQLTTQPV